MSERKLMMNLTAVRMFAQRLISTLMKEQNRKYPTF